jgi:hypothetical protein
MPARKRKMMDEKPRAGDRARAAVRAGEVYSAKARHGRRYVEIESVRGLRGDGAVPHAMVHEVLPSGEKARGWLHGLKRGMSFYVVLTWDAGRNLFKMPNWYSLEEKDGED